MANDYKDAGNLIDLIRTVIGQELDVRDNTAVCVVESVNSDKTLNLYVLPDRQHVINNIINQCRFDFEPGDTALLFKIDNRLSNSFVVAKYNAKVVDEAWAKEATVLSTTVVTNEEDLAQVAYTGNVNNLIQTAGDTVIINGSSIDEQSVE